ncbi:sodium/potassium-transporting ATPase subunit beta-2a isoform X3 [Betta splendens]|uniref:Sodium/potassium-transporting ATPase subunit beta n=1 Tax=Betta splendens TaxID=158456 RepID=A0A8M1HNJ9_BETSP|nr:sodium/potassium-transporting ATPase subunit beta-2a isoform X3 [Betta splendens]
MSGTKEEDRKSSSEWRDFFWNPRTHELLGRTATSWGLILLFYLVFYLFLAGMFALTMYILLLTLDDYKPTWQDQLATPGMMIRPKGDQLEIVYSVSDAQSWDGFVQNLNSFLSPYNDIYQVQTNDNCPPDQYFIQEDSGEVRNNPKRSCQFNRTMLEECSGLSDHFYGYSRGQPCILIKMNRVIGMLPGKDGQSPYVTCGAKVNYTQPLVAVRFLNASLNTDINIECKINSNTLSTGSDRDKFAGRVAFKLRINEK